MSVLSGDWTAATGSEKVTGQQPQEEEEIWNRLPDRREAVIGSGRGLDSTTWMMHCSTCLLISSSLPANGALHSGHTWPPSSGFLLFILPIRAAEERQARRRQTRRSHDTVTRVSTAVGSSTQPPLQLGATFQTRSLCDVTMGLWCATQVSRDTTPPPRSQSSAFLPL